MADSQAKRQIAKVTDYKMVFGTPHGSRVLMDMMKTHGILQSSFDKDPYLTAFKEGERNAVLRILTVLKINVEDIKKRIEEDGNDNT